MRSASTNFSFCKTFAIAAILFSVAGCEWKNQIKQEELARRTQELFDSVAAGDPTPWKKYFAEDSMYFDEKGRNMDKTALVADITPLPPGYSGTIKVENVKSHIEGNVAIMSYDMDEKEQVFGQEETAHYHATDTWMHRNGQWQIVAGQVLRYYEDPARGTVQPDKMRDYIGTYRLAPGNDLTIASDGQRLYRQRGDAPQVELIPEDGEIFFRKGVEGRILFRYAVNKKVDALIDRRNNEDVIWKKIKESR